MSFVILLLAMHPDAQEKCYQELKTLLPDRYADITVEHVNQMPYTEQCIKETLRLFPTVPVIGRTINQDIKLKDITVYQNQSVLLSLRSVMRKKDIWGEDADIFDPDHCSAENLARKPPCAYVPFSEGPRMCIGNIFLFPISIFPSYDFICFSLQICNDTK